MSFPASSFQAVPPPNYAAYANPGLGMALGQMIGQAPQAYMQGRENRQKIEAQDAFPRGLDDPQYKNPDGSVNVDAIVNKGAKIGGLPFVTSMLPFLQNVALGKQSAEDFARISALLGGNPEGPTPQVAHSPNAGPNNIGTTSQPVPQEGEKGPTLNYLLQDAGKSLTQKQVFDFARQIKINPNAELTPDQVEYVSGEIGKLPKPSRNQETSVPNQPASAAEDAANSTSGDAAGNLPASGVSGSPAPAPFMAPGRGQQVAQAAEPRRGNIEVRPLGGQGGQGDTPPASGGLPGNFTERAAQNREVIAGYFRQKAALASAMKNQELSTNYEKAAEFHEGQAKMIWEEMARAAQPTDALKAYAAGKKPGETLVDFQSRQAASIEGAKKEQAATGEHMQKLAEAGLEAVGHKAMLDTVQKLGEKVPYGIIPKIQSELGKFGIETKGLSDIQAYERAVDYMAPQLRPIGSGRLLAPELAAFKASLGGLMTTPEGRRVSVENLKLLSDYKEAIGRIASNQAIPMNQRMTEIYKLPPPHLKTLEDVSGGNAPGVTPPVTGARQGRDVKGNPGWFLPDPKRPGKYLQVQQ